MEIIGYIINFIVFGVLILAWIAMWTHDDSRMTDEQLYGMSAEEYSRKMMGDETYEKYLNQGKDEKSLEKPKSE